MNLYLIRHGMTHGNSEKRYIGITDETLLPESVAKLQEKNIEIDCDSCYVSPLLRCRQTASALFPDKQQIVVDDFRECNFGLFENKNYEELNGNPVYQQFIDTNGQTAFPEGEDQASFSERVVCAFEKLVRDVADKDTLCIVAHGGTIMAILARFAVDAKPFYEWWLGNGAYYEAKLQITDDGEIVIDSIQKKD